MLPCLPLVRSRSQLRVSTCAEDPSRSARGPIPSFPRIPISDHRLRCIIHDAVYPTIHHCQDRSWALRPAAADSGVARGESRGGGEAWRCRQRLPAARFLARRVVGKLRSREIQLHRWLPPMQDGLCMAHDVRFLPVDRARPPIGGGAPTRTGQTPRRRADSGLAVPSRTAGSFHALLRLGAKCAG